VETVVHLWEEEREGCLRHLRGMFALAIWEEGSQTLLLARDRVGKKPLYYHLLGDSGIVFGSEIKAILQHPEVPREPDLTAIDNFLTLQYVPSPLTAFQEVRRLPPAHWLTWQPGRLNVQRYWEPDFTSELQLTEGEIRQEMMRLLEEAVRIRLESEVPLGAFLSGGIDSSAVVALAARSMSSPLKTFSIGFRQARFDESRYARMVADRFATDHHELIVEEDVAEVIDDIVWHYDQPFGDSSAIPSFHVARITRPHVTVVLNGDGGDESFAGYDRYRLARYSSLFFNVPSLARRGLLSMAAPAGRLLGRGQRVIQFRPADSLEAYFATLVHLQPNRKPGLYTDEMLEAVARDDQAAPLRFLKSKHHRSLLDAMLETDFRNYLPDDLLVKMDVATMAHSLEARSPFLDQELCQFMAAVPANLKLRGGTSKHLLKSALRGLLPDEILDRPKMGFGVPLGDWLRTTLREVLLDTVLSDTALSRGYFQPSAVQTMVDRHMAGSDDFMYILWDLLLLEKWHLAFIDNSPTPRQPLMTRSVA
jgi:asparagine synthase (glutamine-hydrolysing)